ncbi:MAG: MucB/RseB C-terminal domain-containing protein [Ramlibacter sp.]
MASTLLPLRSVPARWLVLALALGVSAVASAQQAAAVAPDRGVNEWLLRMQEASRLRSYVGTFVVSSSTGSMSSARIWHAGDATQQIERVEVLTGAPRSTFRRNDEVVTFLPEHHVVRAERHESLGLFPNLLKSSESSIPEFYAARRLGAERVAGFDADLVQLVPKDTLRFGYRVWSEKRTGLVIKLQTLDADGNVLEQAAFSELQLDSPVRPDKLLHMMQPPHGWRVERAEAVKTTPAAEGWGLRSTVAGFRPLNCYKRPAAGAPEGGGIQWIFSDGLASVSLFVEPYDRQRHRQEGVFAAGATQTLTRRIDDWWLTVVGEVPPQTLKAFAQSLERRR